MSICTCGIETANADALCGNRRTINPLLIPNRVSPTSPCNRISFPGGSRTRCLYATERITTLFF